MTRASYPRRVAAALSELGIPLDLVRRRNLPLCAEATSLSVVGVDAHGREQTLAPAAAKAWLRMKAAADRAGVSLHLISAFRSFDRQCEIIRGKLAAGRSLDEILSVSAPPGYSEHHTGRAIDIGASTDDPLEETFERSDAFAWLCAHASRYGYFLSYPRGNGQGYRYEPWHWLYRRRGVS